MLIYALILFAAAVVSGVLGFSGIAGASADIAQMLFFIFLALVVVSLIVRAARRA